MEYYSSIKMIFVICNIDKLKDRLSKINVAQKCKSHACGIPVKLVSQKYRAE
jgi:hypothetical protein